MEAFTTVGGQGDVVGARSREERCAREEQPRGGREEHGDGWSEIPLDRKGEGRRTELNGAISNGGREDTSFFVGGMEDGEPKGRKERV